MGAGVGATKEGKMAPNFSQATPDRALRFSILSAVNRRVASSNLARGAIFLPESKSLTQHVTATLCGCNRVQLRVLAGESLIQRFCSQ